MVQLQSRYMLDSKYGDVKSSIIEPKNTLKVKESWDRLLPQLEKKIDEIKSVGPTFVPEVRWDEVSSNEKLPPAAEKLFKERGCLIVRGVIPPSQAVEWKKSLEDYITAHPQLTGKTFQEVHWSKCQVQARSHPNMIKLFQYVGKIWKIEDSEDSLVDESISIVYPDRARIRKPGAAVTLPLHQDSGSIERWEDEYYRKVYQEVWDGKWEDWNPWLMDRRLQGQQDLYGDLGQNGSVCSTFRTLQGWLGLSPNVAGEGTIKFLPNLKEVVPYLLLRPFFNENGEFDPTTSYFPGADPGTGQFFAPDDAFSHLKQLESVISIPNVEPGDFVFWHADLLHEVDREHNGNRDSSVCYIGQCPLSAYNINTMEDTIQKFLSGEKPRDWAYVNNIQGHTCENDFSDRSQLSDILTLNGLQAIGLKPFDETDSNIRAGARKVRALANRRLASYQILH